MSIHSMAASLPPGPRAAGASRSGILNIGSGHRQRAGAVNLDINRDTHPDVVHDLNHRPWPFPDAAFSEVHAYDVLEHLDDVMGTMEEIHRICRPGAMVYLTMPHFTSSNAFTDITHRHQFGWFSFHYFTGEHEFSYYTRVRFKRRRTELVFHATLANKLVWRLANRYPEQYERRWGWMFPAWFLSVEMEVVKA
jgi:SAM-dependent methyltransferase